MKKLGFFLEKATTSSTSLLRSVREKAQPVQHDEFATTESIDIETGFVEIKQIPLEEPTQTEANHTLYEQFLLQSQYIHFLEDYFSQPLFTDNDFTTLYLDSYPSTTIDEAATIQDFIVVGAEQKTHDALQSKIHEQKVLIEEHMQHIRKHAQSSVQDSFHSAAAELTPNQYKIEHNTLLLTHCLEQPYGFFEIDKEHHIESFYDKKQNLLILRAPEHIDINLADTLPYPIQYVYLLGNFSLQHATLDIDRYLYSSGMLHLLDTTLKCPYVMHYGAKIDLIDSTLKTKCLHLENQIHIRDTKLDSTFTILNGEITSLNTTLNTQWYNGSFKTAEFEHFNLSCHYMLSTGLPDQPLVFKHCTINATFLVTHHAHRFESTTFNHKNSEKGAYILQDDVSFAECRLDILNAIQLGTHATLILEQACEFKLSHLDIRGNMMIQDTKLICHKLSQSQQLTLVNCMLEVQSIFKMDKTSSTQCGEDVMIVAESIHVGGHLTEYQQPPAQKGTCVASAQEESDKENGQPFDDWEMIDPDFENDLPQAKHAQKTITFDVKQHVLVHKYAEINIQMHHLKIMAKTIDLRGQCLAKVIHSEGNVFNNFGLLLAEQASLTCSCSFYNQGNVIVDELTINGNFFNILGEIYVKKTLLVQQGLLEMNVGLIVANNHSQQNRVARNIGITLPHMHAEYADFFTYKNICSIAAKVVPTFLPEGKYVISLSAKIPSLIGQLSKLLTPNPSAKNTSSLFESLQNIWTNQICNNQAVNSIKQLILKELNDVYHECSALMVDNGQYEEAWFGRQIIHLVNTIEDDELEDWFTVNLDNPSSVPNETAEDASCSANSLYSYS